MWEYSSEFQKYEEYYNSIITGIGFILGLIVAVTIFYLGKFHDYYKNILEMSNKNRIDFDSYMDSFNIAEKKFKEFSESSVKFFKSVKEYDIENIEESKESCEKYKKSRETKLTTFKEIGTALECDEAKKVNLSKYSRNIIIDFVIYAVPFVASFLLSTWFLEDPTVGKFYFLIIQVILSIVNFFLYWFSSNERINDILKYYNSMLNLSRMMNKAELQEKNHMQDYEEWKNMFLKNTEKFDRNKRN